MNPMDVAALAGSFGIARHVKPFRVNAQADQWGESAGQFVRISRLWVEPPLVCAQARFSLPIRDGDVSGRLAFLAIIRG